MLEIIGIIFFTRHLVTTLRMKGQSAWIAAIGPVFWIVGEFVGAFVAACAGIDGLVLYLGALVGALVGAGVAYGIVSALPTNEDSMSFVAGRNADSGVSCPECGSVQTEVIGSTIVCNACDAQSPRDAFAAPSS